MYVIKSLSLKKGFSHKDAKIIRPLCIFLSKMSAYIRDFDETKDLSFLIKDDELWEKYKEICEKVKNSIKNEFDSESVFKKNI